MQEHKIFRCQISDDFCHLFFYCVCVCVCVFFNELSLGKKIIYKIERLTVKQRRSRLDSSF